MESEKLKNLENENQNKQNMIDRLTAEVDLRNEAIHNCGVEIVALRKKLSESNFLLMQYKNNTNFSNEQDFKMTNELANLDSIEREIILNTHNNKSNNVSKTIAVDLMNRIRILGKKYLIEKSKNVEIVDKLSVLNVNASRDKQENNRIRELERALEAQAIHIQKLQSNNSKIEKYKETIITQEKGKG